MSENRYYLGIDAGATFCKAMIINSNRNQIVSKALTLIQGNPKKAAETCIKEMLKEEKISEKELKKNAVSTGQNGNKTAVGKKISEITCIGEAAYFLNPKTRIVVDVGSFSMKVLKMDETGTIKDYLMNDKCAAGSGVLLELVGEGLEMEVDEISEKASESDNPIQISSQCSIFAESEVISYKNEGANVADLLAGVCNSVAGRIYPLVRKVDQTPQDVAFTGGVALNSMIVKNLEKRLNIELLKLGIEPQYIAAYGAALLAKKHSGGN